MGVVNNNWHHNTNSPAVSVIIPAYNYARFLPRAIKSVITQTLRDFEVIVVDDGSTDDTAAVARGYLSDPRVRYIYQENRGLSAARNTGISLAKGKYIAFLDADDLWLPEKLEKQLRIFEREAGSVALVYCFIEYIDEQGTVLESAKELPVENPTLGDLLYANWVLGSGSSVLIKKEAFDRVGLFDEELRSLEDMNMWLRILHEYDSARADEVLVRITRHRRSMQSDLRTMERNMLLHIEKGVDMFPELKTFEPEARFQIYKGLLYLSYFHNVKKKMFLYYLKAGCLRPSFLFEVFLVFLRKYFLRRKRYF
jgi:glycosyltransferase involved in cell wall biosynthesis